MFPATAEAVEAITSRSSSNVISRGGKAQLSKELNGSGELNPTTCLKCLIFAMTMKKQTFF